MSQVTFNIWRSENQAGFQEYKTEITEGMVVLDAVHQIQAESAPDLAVELSKPNFLDRSFED